MKHLLAPRRGFSLLELLVVIAVIALLLGLAVPAVVSVSQGQSMKKAVGLVSSTLDLAKSQAMATSTWVWVGFSEDPQDCVVTIACVASRDATKNTEASNLTSLVRPFRVQNVMLLKVLTGLARDDAVPMKDSSYSFSQMVAGREVHFSGTVLAFAPSGEVGLRQDAFSPWVEIGIRECRNGQGIDARTASIMISGLSGNQKITY